MQRKFFVQLIVFIAVLLMIFLFFFPNYKYVQRIILRRIEVINMLLLIGLYIKELFKE